MASVDGTFVGSLPIDAGRHVPRSPRFTAPREVGCFSVVGEHREYLNGRAELKYLCMPRQPNALSWDLNSGLHKAVWSDFSTPEKLDKLLTWITENKQRLTSNQRPKRDGPGVDFVCKRGLLSTLARTPFKPNDDWQFSATRFKDTLYICKFESESQKAWEAKNREISQQMNFWGHKFEQYMTSDQPGTFPDTEAPLRSGDQFYVVMKGALETHSLLFTGEVDAIDNDVTHKPGSMDAYVEFKTARVITHRGQERNFFGNRLLSCWSQSFLAGVPRVFVGFRTKEGVVQSVEEYSVDEMPHLARGQWSDRVCLSFLNEMLHFIKECVTEDDPNVVYLFTFDRKKENKVICKKLSDPGEYQLITPSYLDAFSR